MCLLINKTFLYQFEKRMQQMGRGFSIVHWCQLKLKTISHMGFAHPSRPHPLTPSPTGEAELNLWLPSHEGERGWG
ncbi:hypothetical protein NSTC745_01353 [Nostoc sp. DSM 114161]|jgi:hypothetical protein